MLPFVLKSYWHAQMGSLGTPLPSALVSARLWHRGGEFVSLNRDCLARTMNRAPVSTHHDR